MYKEADNLLGLYLRWEGLNAGSSSGFFCIQNFKDDTMFKFCDTFGQNRTILTIKKQISLSSVITTVQFFLIQLLIRCINKSGLTVDNTGQLLKEERNNDGRVELVNWRNSGRSKNAQVGLGRRFLKLHEKVSLKMPHVSVF